MLAVEERIVVVPVKDLPPPTLGSVRVAVGLQLGAAKAATANEPKSVHAETIVVYETVL